MKIFLFICLIFFCTSCQNNNKSTTVSAEAKTANIELSGQKSIKDSKLPFSELRHGFITKLTGEKKYNQKADTPPTNTQIQLVKFPTAIGDMVAYLSKIPNDNKLHPAIIWISGGFGNDIGDVWSLQEAENDQSVSVFYRSGIITMYPSQRGGNMNPGSDESAFGEIDDIIAAAEFLRRQKGVDTSRIYLGGHSTGGTKVLLTAACYHKFKGVFSFGAVPSYGDYGFENLYFDIGNLTEIELRTPILWLSSIKTPTWIIEGTEGSSNIMALTEFEEQAKAKNCQTIRCIPIQGADHFSVLNPVCKKLAIQIKNNTLKW